jgi:hypothetical protein
MYLLEIWQYSPFYDPIESLVVMWIFHLVLNANILIIINEQYHFIMFSYFIVVMKLYLNEKTLVIIKTSNSVLIFEILTQMLSIYD